MIFIIQVNEPRNHINQRRKHKTWTRDNNQFTLHYYFKSNPSQRGYIKKKRMIKIWQECASFHTTSQKNRGLNQDNNKEKLVF